MVAADETPGFGRFVEAFEAVPDAVVFVSPTGSLLAGNRAAVELFGYQPGEWRNRPSQELIHPDDVASALASLASVQDKSSSGSLVEIRIRHATGGYRHAELRGRSATLDGVQGVLLVVRDLTDRRRWEVTTGDAGAMQTLVQAAPVIVLRLDKHGIVLSANGALVRELGHSLEDSLGEPFRDLCAPTRDVSVDEELAIAASVDRHQFEVLLRSSGDRVIPYLVRTVNLLDDDAVTAIVAFAQDITDLHLARAKLAHQATHDDLTGLPNRALLDDRLALALERSERTGEPVSVLFVDLDGFKAFNDRWGHVLGDLLLRATTARLAGQLRTVDTVARIGGDEFAIVAEDVDELGAAQLVERIEAAFAETYVIGGATFQANASIGAVTTRGMSDPASIMASADRSMYADKRRKRSRPTDAQGSTSSHRGSTASSQ